jgi:hypothetical protein
MDKNKFKNIITNINDWEDVVKGGTAKDKTPDDFDIDDLSRGSEMEMEHTDDPHVAIDIAMDHLAEFDDYYDEKKGLPNFEKQLSDEDGLDDIEEDEVDNFNDELDDELDDELGNIDDDELSDIDDFEQLNQVQENRHIKKFSSIFNINENNSQKKYPKEFKFKRISEYDNEIEKSLNEHNFQLSGNKKEGKYIIFDIMDKSYELVDEFNDEIRPTVPLEFDHIMDNL